MLEYLRFHLASVKSFYHRFREAWAVAARAPQVRINISPTERGDEELRSAARMHGMLAGQKGVSRKTNPFPQGSDEQLMWYKGWCVGMGIQPYVETSLQSWADRERAARAAQMNENARIQAANALRNKRPENF